jgi:hypothetical protein
VPSDPFSKRARKALATDYVTDAVLKSAKSEKWEAVQRA